MLSYWLVILGAVFLAASTVGSLRLQFARRVGTGTAIASGAAMAIGIVILLAAAAAL